ncbi:hypothetical protein ACJBXD_11220, partial [Streptococcus suis]
RRVIDRTSRIEQVSPFVWTIARTGPGRVTITGHRPAEVGASALRERLAPLLPRETILDDGAKAARGAPPGFLEAASFA